MIENEIDNVQPDRKFAYYLLGAAGICVVPLTGFCSRLQGFRITLLEKDWDTYVEIVDTLAEKLEEYLS